MAQDYGSGQSGAVIVDQSGPIPPGPEDLVIAKRAASGRLDSGLPVACMDCVPNIVLKDFIDHDCCGGWHWGMLVAHDDTCPASNGVTAAPRE